jgi:outer membrane usher protein
MNRWYAAVAIAAAGLWSAPALAAGPAPGWAVTAIVEAPQPPVRINPTGRTYEIEVPLKLDDDRLGDVGIKITADDKIFVDAKLLKTYLGKTFKQEILTAAIETPEDWTTQLADAETVAAKKEPGAAASSIVQKASIGNVPEPGQLGQEKPTYIALDLLIAKGLAMRYNPNDLELQVEPKVDQRLPGDISFAPKAEEDSASLEKPAYASAWLNMSMVTSYVSQSSSGNTGVESPNFNFDGATRIGAFVLEGEGSFYTGNARGFAQNFFQDYVLYRRGTRLVYDMPEDAVRIRAGDVTPDFTGFQTSADLLGVSATKSYAQLQPGKSIRPTGAHSFRLERPSTVDILIGNALVRRLKLGPGIYNLSDLPLQAGANDIKLVIEDDTGTRQTIEFSAFSGYELLAPGTSEWFAGAGVKSLDTGIANYAGATTLGGTTFVNKTSNHSFYGQRAYHYSCIYAISLKPCA